MDVESDFLPDQWLRFNVQSLTNRMFCLVSDSARKIKPKRRLAETDGGKLKMQVWGQLNDGR